MLKVLTFSTLFPSSVRPGHGIFVETRLRELLKTGAVEAKVVAPVPWFPSTDARWGSYARVAATPRREQRNGLDVLHPRYALVPKVGMTAAPLGLALGAAGSLRRLRAEGFDFDLIDAHYFYPDGVAAALLARWFRRPLMITARGSDLSLIPQHAAPRRMMQWAAAQARACIGVCAPLVDILRQWQVPEPQLHVIRNGVDLDRFRPLPRGEARAALGLEGGPVFISVGNLIELKGHHLVIEALQQLLQRAPDARLLILGEGPERAALEALVAERGLAARVTLAGRKPNEELKTWYSAADALVLASSREGWANVLLEAMACGTPVVATRIWGTPDVVQPDSGGLLVDRTVASIREGMQALLDAPPPREAVRAYASRFSWDVPSRMQAELMHRLAMHRPGVNRETSRA